MMSMADESAGQSRRLFAALAEDLKLPLLTISRTAELHRLNGGQAPALQEIEHTAAAAIRLLDSYASSVQAGLTGDRTVPLAPISLAAVLCEAERELRDTARRYDVQLELCLQPKHEPVLSNAEALQTVLVGLGRALIAALPAAGGDQRCLRLASHRTKYGQVAGLYGTFPALTPRALRRGRQLYGTVRQPMVAALAGSGAGIFVADTIAEAMQLRLRIGRFERLPGFALTLPSSRQLRLV